MNVQSTLHTIYDSQTPWYNNACEWMLLVRSFHTSSSSSSSHFSMSWMMLRRTNRRKCDFPMTPAFSNPTSPAIHNPPLTSNHFHRHALLTKSFKIGQALSNCLKSHSPNLCFICSTASHVIYVPQHISPRHSSFPTRTKKPSSNHFSPTSTHYNHQPAAIVNNDNVSTLQPFKNS